MACQRMINKITTTGPTSRAGIIYSSGETVFNSGSTEVQAVHFLRIPVHVTLVVLRCVMSTLIVASKLFNSSLPPFVFVGDSCFICYLHWFLYRYPTLFIFKIMFVSFKKTWLEPLVEQELLTFCSTWVHTRCLVQFVLLGLRFSVQYFVDHCLFVFCPFSFWPLYDGFWLTLW
jgi:hypothetical protein